MPFIPYQGNQRVRWKDMSPYQRTQEVWELEEEMYDLPPIPAEERQKPLRNVLQFVLRGLQVPSSMISGFAWQLLDKQPGFDTREFLEWTFGKDQGTWGDVIQELAARNPNDNFWDRRVAQVAFGLALDIALDPLNFLGGGVVKSIGKIDDIGDIARAAGKAAKNLWDNMGVAKTLGRKNPQLGNRIARNLENIMSGRGVGFQINPLGRTLDVPLTRQARFAAQHQDDIARLAGKMSRQGAMGGAGGIAPQAAEKVLQADPFFQTMYKMAQRRTVPQMVDDFLAYVPIAKNLYRPLRKAFASGKTAFTRALETRELLKTRIAKNQSDVQAVLKRAAKEIPGWNKEMSELARQYLQNYKGMLFKNGGAVKVIMLKAKMMSDMISKLPAAKLAGKNHEDFIQGMIKVNEGYRDIITDEIAFILERYLPGNMANAPKTLAEAAKNLPYKQLVKNAEYLYDKNSIRMLESMLTDPKNHLELPFDEELLKMGAYRPLKRKFTETEQFAKRYNELPIGHKKMLDTYMDDVRRMVDKWWDDEMRAGIHSQYRVGYLPSYAPPKGFKKQGLEMGGRFAPFQFHSSHRTSEAMEVALAKRLIKADYVKIKEPSAELIEEVGEEVARKRMMKEALKRAREEVRNGNETFGQVFYTLEGSVYYRGSTHAKQMARKGMVEELAQYGVRYPDDASKLMGYKRVDTNVAPELSEYVFDEDTADIITRAVNIVQDETTNQFMSMVEKATDWWKFVVTSANPGFHLRNFYSNHFLGWLWQGPSYFNPKHHKDAGKLVAKGLFPRGYDNAIRRVFGETVPDKYLDQVFAHGKTKRELLDFARERGLIRREFRFAEMARSHDVQRILKKKIKRLFPYGRDSFVGEGAEIVGSLVENEARVAAFLNQFQKTGDMMGSFIKTQEVFVNYLRRTPFEEQIWKNVMPFWCVPDSAEILTRDGWKTHDQLEIGEEVYTYNINTDRAEWQPDQKKAVFDFDGELVRLKNRHFDALCTEDHRWPVRSHVTFMKGKRYGNTREIKRTYEINNNWDFIVSAPGVDQESVLSVRDATILGWIVTDGHVRSRSKNGIEAVIYQHPKKYADKIRKLLGNDLSGENVHPSTGVIQFRLKASYYHNHIEPVYSGKKDLPSIVTRLSKEAAEAMRDAMVEAEGTVGHAGTNREFVSFTGKNQDLLDAFQILCSMTGKSIRYGRERDNGCRCGYIRKPRYSQYAQMNITKEPYRGKVWCPVTPNSTWLMRQCGRVCFTGNTWAKQNTANMVKFIFLQPRRMSKIPKVAISVENLVREDVPDEFLPDYYEEQWMWQLPINLPDGTPLFFNPDFPIQDLNRLAFDPANIGGSFRYMVSNALGMLGPAIKVPIEQIPRQGYDIFRDRPIEQWPGQKKPLPGVAQHLARLFYDVAPDTMEAIGATLEGGHVVVPAKFAKGLNDLLPFVRNAARWVAANPDKEGVEKVFDTLSYIGGLKVQPLDTLSQEYYYLLNEVKARKEYWRDLGYDV